MTPDDIPAEVFSGKPHKLTMGLRPLDMSTWLDPDPDDPQRVERRRLVEQHRDEVFGALPGSDDACSSVAVAVSRWVGVPLAGEDHPLLEAALLVRDDLCVLARVQRQWTLVAGVVCFPSRWRLSDKLGRDVMTIHDPVPGYRSRLEAPTQQAFAAIAGHAARWRVNATLVDDPELFQPVAPEGRTHRPGPASYLRVERQCLVPVGDLIVFSIRTSVRAVAELSPVEAEAVLSAAHNTPDDLAAYRGWSPPDA